MRNLQVRDMGRLGYAEAWDLQRAVSEQRKRGEIPDQLLFVEHPHVFTLGRNAHWEHLLVSRDQLPRLGIDLHEIDRGGDITYHGPGQIVGYPIFDLREWKRDVVAFVRGIEEAIIRTLGHWNIKGAREAGATGVWTGDAKICAIGVHLSRWVSTHGFALNVTTDLRYFDYIVPCGLTRPVTSLAALGVMASRDTLQEAIVREFVDVFGYDERVGWTSESPALALAE